jgi:hypothetical protein
LRPAGEVQHSVSRLARRGLGQAPVVGRGRYSLGLGFVAAWQAGGGAAFAAFAAFPSFAPFPSHGQINGLFDHHLNLQNRPIPLLPSL